MELAANTYLKNGTYRIEKKIGEGGFGITYQSTWFTKVSGNLGSIDAQLPVAIKEFFFEDFCSREGNTNSITILSTTGKEIFSRFKEKLLKEAEILSKLSHPNIVRVIEVFEENNTAYMVMDYIEGDSLKDKIKNGKLSIDTSIEYILQIAAALEDVHAKNILHLDLKPSNILINKKDGRAMLIDFGISKRYNDTHEETSHTPLGRSKGYAPLEQYLDKGAASFSPALDVYALGATLYHLVTGAIPVEANERVLNDIKRPSALNNKITKDLEDILLKALELKKENRYQTIGAFAQALRTTLSDKTEIIKPTVSIEAAVVNITTKKITENENTGSQPAVKILVDNKNKIAAATPVKTSSNKKLAWLIAGAAIIAIAAVGIYYYLNEKDEPEVFTPAQIAQRDSLYFLLEDTTIKLGHLRGAVAAMLAQLGPIPDSLRTKPNPRYNKTEDILNSFLIKKSDPQDSRKTEPSSAEILDSFLIKKRKEPIIPVVLHPNKSEKLDQLYLADEDSYLHKKLPGLHSISIYSGNESAKGNLSIAKNTGLAYTFTGSIKDGTSALTMTGQIKVLTDEKLSYTGTIWGYIDNNRFNLIGTFHFKKNLLTGSWAITESEDISEGKKIIISFTL
jgi:serine/threonine protein kinase